MLSVLHQTPVCAIALGVFVLASLSQAIDFSYNRKSLLCVFDKFIKQLIHVTRYVYQSLDSQCAAGYQTDTCYEVCLLDSQ